MIENLQMPELDCDSGRAPNDQNSTGGKTQPTFDIFTDSPDAQPVWIESAQDLEDARERLREVARIAPRRNCFIYSEESGVHADFQALRRHIDLT